MEFEKTTKQEKETSDRNYKVGLLLGTVCYSCVKMGLGQSAYEKLVTMLSATGADVGHLNHGFQFCADLTSSLYGALRTRMSALLKANLPGSNLPTPICVLADKATPNKQSMQIIAIIGVVNGQLDTIFLDSVGVPSHTGEGISDTIYQCLKEEFSKGELRKR